MDALATADTFEPVVPSERYANLDVIRGVALFGVLIVNLLYFFRVSLFEHVINFHTHPGQVNRAIDLTVATLLEFKAFNLFSLCFGIGVAVQAERVALRNFSVAAFLFRRFSILLAFGLIHMVFISNVDILSLYAICGLFLIPVLRLPAVVLGVAGLAAVYLPALPLDGLTRLAEEFLLQESMWREHADLATRIYSQGTFAQALSFRWSENSGIHPAVDRDDGTEDIRSDDDRCCALARWDYSRPDTTPSRTAFRRHLRRSCRTAEYSIGRCCA